MANLQELLRRDQELIQKYRSELISKEEYLAEAKEVSDNFYISIQNSFPYPEINPEDYRASVVLSLHLELEKLEKIFKKYVHILLKNDSAMIQDKILVLQGKPQLYGTQVTFNESNEVELLPVVEPEKLRQRREEMGLMPLDNYLNMFKKSDNPSRCSQ